MAMDTSAGIVRILRSDGNTSGTGFVVSGSGLIATCSHVVQNPDAQTIGEKRPDRVTVVFNATGDQTRGKGGPGMVA